MPTTTTNYSFNKPVVGGDEDAWGGYLNGNWDTLDTLLGGVTNAELAVLDGATLGSVTASKVVTADANGDVTFPDGEKAIFGTGSDLQIYHDGTSSIISDQGVGPLLLRATDFQMTNSAGSQYIIQGADGGAVTLYYAGSGKIATTTGGVTVTGTVTADGISLGDGETIRVGAGDDLQIQHDGSHSIMKDVGTGNFYLQSNGGGVYLTKSDGTATLAQFENNGPCSLRYNGTTRFATTSVGADVTGEFIADSYNETYVSLSGTTPTVDCESGNVFALSTTGNTTFTFSNPPASGTAYGFTLKLTAGGTHTITYPASVDWAGATAPDAPASGETDLLVFMTHDGGTTWYGARAIDAAG